MKMFVSIAVALLACGCHQPLAKKISQYPFPCELLGYKVNLKKPCEFVENDMNIKCLAEGASTAYVEIKNDQDGEVAAYFEQWNAGAKVTSEFFYIPAKTSRKIVIMAEMNVTIREAWITKCHSGGVVKPCKGLLEAETWWFRGNLQ